eukprot:m.22177 g.22177  ORF g.22177 m.22177 type:complete len:261 (+) comp3714_c0_seq1:1532-2314(+)
MPHSCCRPLLLRLATTHHPLLSVLPPVPPPCGWKITSLDWRTSVFSLGRTPGSRYISNTDMSFTPGRQPQSAAALRRDKISARMGEYMLKGYCMLGSHCDVCGTVLLRDRQKNLHCVACEEIDPQASDAPAADVVAPALEAAPTPSTAAATAPAAPIPAAPSSNAPAAAASAAPSAPQPAPSASATARTTTAPATAAASGVSVNVAATSVSAAVLVAALGAKLQDIGAGLARVHDPREVIAWCEAIQKLTETIKDVSTLL